MVNVDLTHRSFIGFSFIKEQGLYCKCTALQEEHFCAGGDDDMTGC